MRIIDNETDYYDFALGTAFDPVIGKSDVPYTRHDRRFYSAKDGKLIPCGHNGDSLQIPMIFNELLEYVNKLPIGFIFTISSFQIFKAFRTNSGLGYHWKLDSLTTIDERIDDAKKKNDGKRFNWRTEYRVKDYERLAELLSRLNHSDLENLVTLLNAPLILFLPVIEPVSYETKDAQVMTNPIIQKTGLKSFPDPMKMYAEIEMGIIILNDPTRKMVSVSEPEIIEKKGFDSKTSFRKRK